MSNSKRKGSFLLVLVTYLAFVSLGLPDGLLGIAWPSMSIKFHMPLDALGLLLLSFTIGYLIASALSGKIMAIIPLGPLLSLSCGLTGFSLLTYAFSEHWFLVLFASSFLGMGGGAIDASINTFAASRFNASVVNWLHAFYGIGATSGPLIITFLFSQNLSWHHGYITVAAIQITLSLVFLATTRYWKVASPHTEEQNGVIPLLASLRQKAVMVNILVFFLYTGLEIGIGQWLFTLLTQSRNIGEEQAGLWTSAYWGSLTVGRILFGIVLTKLPVRNVLLGAVAGIMAGTALLSFPHNNLLSLGAILLIGFANAPVFPSLISITPNFVGKEHGSNAIGFQISAAMLGGALLPGGAGLLANSFGWEAIPLFFVAVAILLLLLYISSFFKKLKNDFKN